MALGCHWLCSGSGCSAGSGLSGSEEFRQWLPVCWAHWPWSFTESYNHTQSSVHLILIEPALLEAGVSNARTNQTCAFRVLLLFAKDQNRNSTF